MPANPNSNAEPANSLGVLSASSCGQAGQCLCSQTVTDSNEVVDTQSSNPAHAAGSSILSVMLSIGVAFFPKCPFCWAGYMSLLGVASLESIPYSPWLKPVMVAALAVNLFVMYRMSRVRQFHIPLYFSCAGAGLLLMQTDVGTLTSLGLGLTMLGAVLNSVPQVLRILPSLQAPQASRG